MTPYQLQFLSWRCENRAFLRDFLQIHKVEDVKTKLSCEAFFNFQQLKMWKRSFRARLSPTSNNWRCENEAFVRDFLQSFNFQGVKVTPELAVERGRFENDPTTLWTNVISRCHASAISQKRISCETSFKLQQLKMRKRSFPSRRPFNSNSWSCENEAFVRDFPQTLQVWDVTTKLFPLTSLSSDIPLLWHPFSVTSLGYDMHCISIAIRNTEVRLSNFLWLERPIDLRLCVYMYISGWWFQPLWKIWTSFGMIIPNICKNKIDGNQTTNQ